MTDAQKATLHKTIETCGTCHGVNGRSVSPTFPNLAAQTAPYIEMQLHAFKDQTRADPDAQAYMWGMASPLSDATISGLAKYFSSAAGPSRQTGESRPHRSRASTCSRRGFPPSRFLPVRPATELMRKAWRASRGWRVNMPRIC